MESKLSIRVGIAIACSLGIAVAAIFFPSRWSGSPSAIDELWSRQIHYGGVAGPQSLDVYRKQELSTHDLDLIRGIPTIKRIEIWGDTPPPLSRAEVDSLFSSATISDVILNSTEIHSEAVGDFERRLCSLPVTQLVTTEIDPSPLLSSMSRMGGLESLSVLQFPGSEFRLDGGFEQLQTLEIEFRPNQFTEHGRISISPLKRLHKLRVALGDMKDAYIDISHMTELRNLEIDVHRVSRDVVLQIGGCDRISSVRLVGLSVDKDKASAWNQFRSMRSVRHLELDSCIGLDSISGEWVLPRHLESLALNHCHGSVGVFITAGESVQELVLVDDIDVRFIPKLPRLRRLRIEGRVESAENLQWLSSIDRLALIEVTNVSVGSRLIDESDLSFLNDHRVTLSGE